MTSQQDPVALAEQLINIPSITPVSHEHQAAANATLDFIEQLVTPTGAKCHRLNYSGDHPKWHYPVDNLYVEWNFGSAERHLCFLGHTDVVPVGDITRWQEPPFSATKKDGWLYGRGATDMKGAIAAYLSALLTTLPSLAEQNNLRLSLIITTDEEWAAINGTKKVLQWMDSKKNAPTFCIVGEPSSQDTLGSHIKIGRRGSLCGTLVAQGTQGHAAYPSLFNNPNRALSLATSVLNTLQFNDQKGDFPATQFEVIAQESGDFAATAIVPAQAQALWNIRFTPEYTASALADLLKTYLEKPPAWCANHPDYDTLKYIDIKANIDTASQPYYSQPGQLAALACQAVTDVTQLSPILDGSGGTTDGRFIHQYFPDAEIIELGLPEKGGMCLGHQAQDYGTRGGMHQVDERCSISDLETLHSIYLKLIKQLAENP